MDICRGILFHIIVVVLNMIKFGNAGKYEPLYFTSDGTELDLIFDARYDETENHYIMKASNQKIFTACPSNDEESNMFDVRDCQNNEAAVLPLCEKPIKSCIYKADEKQYNSDKYKAVGFAIQKLQLEVFDENSAKNIVDDSAQNKSQENLDNAIEITSDDKTQCSGANQVSNSSYRVLSLIIFQFDDINQRIKFVWHNIAFGKFLKPEITREGNESYQNNEGFYEYDLESLYSPTSPYVKVQLAPEEDFFFESWKSASRQNVLTAPMRRDLVPQWQLLEIFTRKVTQIIDMVAAMTGIHDTIYLYEGQYPIPRLFYKVIGIYYTHKEIKYPKGIVFVLHNVDPQVHQNVDKICPNDYVSNLGWAFLNEVKYKNLMYACLWNKTNMRALGGIEDDEIENFEHDALNLYDVPLIRLNENNEEIVERVNVIKKINENSGGLNRIVSYVFDVVNLPFKLFSSYYRDEWI